MTHTLFVGTDTYGRGIEVAFRDTDSVPFCRYYRHNGFAMAWSKWAPDDTAHWHPIVCENVFSGETIKGGGAHVLSWGLNTLKLVPGARIRLPK